MTDREIIERLMQKVEDVRQHQKQYFKNRNEVNKRLSIGKETDLDNYVKELKRLGYKPSNPGSAEQKNLF